MKVPGLRSPYEKTLGVSYFGRMIDKIRLQQKSELPDDYRANVGKGFDGRCVRFLHVEYAAVVERVLAGGTEEELLEWCFQTGRRPLEEEIYVWNEFMRKVGWNDEVTPTLQRRLAEGGFQNRPDIQTIFDYMELDEGRDPASKG
jgi:hypothetical protein